MSEFNIFPSVNEELQFPPSVKLALLASPEFAARFGNVNNTTDAAKPISTATQTALNLKAPLASPTFTGTVKGVTKSHVGLANVDNTSDANKPISTAVRDGFVPRWKAGTAYTVGQQVVAPSPADMVVTCTTAHTAGSSFAADVATKWNGFLFAGTTTERNTIFGTPTTDAQHVALANKMVRFYNTTEGWWESYYSPTKTGLTAKNLIPGNNPGWYPDAGSDLRAHRGRQGGFQSITAATDIAPVLGDFLLNTKGRFTKTGDAGIQVPIGGYYRIFGNVYFSGAAAPNIVANIKLGSLTILNGGFGKPTANDSTASASGIYPVVAGDSVVLNGWASQNTAFWGTTGYNGTRLTIEYAGPPLSN